MIDARSLHRRYGDFTAVHDVSFSVAEGEIVGLLGPNGAGKTTTLRMITGFLPPSAGRVTLDGHDLFAAPRLARRQLGYLPENVPLYPDMRVGEYLHYRARLQGMRGASARRAIDDALGRCLLDDVARQIIGTLSKGYRQRVGLASAILHAPKALVLDEPTVGLDPRQIVAIRDLIRDLGRSRTLILSTHILPEVEQLCDRVLIIDRGRLLAEGTASDLRTQAGGRSAIVVGFDAPPSADDRAAFAQLDGVEALDDAPDGDTADDATTLHLRQRPDADVRADVFRCAVERGLTLVELREVKASLEDIFVRLTTDDRADAAPNADGSDAAPTDAEEPAP
ncbi:MAG: ABC transporter ATP-binding protein [Acidobacteriota bacterium]